MLPATGDEIASPVYKLVTSHSPRRASAPTDARYTRRRRPVLVDSVRVRPVTRHRRTRSSASRYFGSTLPAAPSHAISVLTPSFSIFMREPSVVYELL